MEHIFQVDYEKYVGSNRRGHVGISAVSQTQKSRDDSSKCLAFSKNVVMERKCYGLLENCPFDVFRYFFF